MYIALRNAYVISKTSRKEYNYILIKFSYIIRCNLFLRCYARRCFTPLIFLPISKHINVIKRWYIFDAVIWLPHGKNVLVFVLFFSLRVIFNFSFNVIFSGWFSALLLQFLKTFFMLKCLCEINVWKILEIVYFQQRAPKKNAQTSYLCVCAWVRELFFLIHSPLKLAYTFVHISWSVYTLGIIYYELNWPNQHEYKKSRLKIKSFSLKYLPFNEMMVTMKKKIGKQQSKQQQQKNSITRD